MKCSPFLCFPTASHVDLIQQNKLYEGATPGWRILSHEAFQILAFNTTFNIIIFSPNMVTFRTREFAGGLGIFPLASPDALNPMNKNNSHNPLFTVNDGCVLTM